MRIHSGARIRQALHLLAAIPLTVLTLQACAQESVEQAAAGEVAETAAVESAAPSADIPEEYAHLANALPGLTISGIKKSAVSGLLEVSSGADVFYMTEDGKYFMQAEIFELESQQNITEEARSGARAAYIADLSEDSVVTFKAENEQYKVLVFTDIDCPYCRKLHREMAAYNDLGITVEYLFFPRSGPNTDSWSKADAVWCADSRQQGMDDAKNGAAMQVPEGCADTPTAEHYQLGRSLGVTGTPAIFTESGTLIVGYRPAAELKVLLDKETAGEEG